MKIKHSKTEYATIGNGLDTSIKAGIREQDLGIAFTMVSKNLYSNPIGSFIREITANAVDANYEAGVSNPVIIEIYPEDEDIKMSFKDQGLGITPDKFNKIYMNIFASDKRDSDEKIGGWGLGSKSPLAYQDMFELITIADGIKYHYVLDNSNTNLVADLLLEEETDEPNGTTVIVEINPLDLNTVNRECHKQLSYFTDVFVKDHFTYYDNEYTIYDGGFFLLKNRERPYDHMHIAVNGVPYPIDWATLGVESYAVPIALKCDFETLDVTLSRETINYTEDVKEYLLKRIVEAQDYFDDLYAEGLQTDDPFKFIQMNLEGNQFVSMTIGEIEIDVKLTNAKPLFTPMNLRLKNKRSASNLLAGFTIKSFTENGYTNNNYKSVLQTVRYAHSSTYYTLEERISIHDMKCAVSGDVLRKKLNKEAVLEIANALGYTNPIEGSKSWHSLPSRYTLKSGALKIVNDWNKLVFEVLKTKFTCIDGIADEEWIENYKAEQALLREERKESVTHYSIYNSMSSVNYGKLLDTYKAIFLISKKEDKNKIVAYNTLFKNFPYDKRFKFLIVNPTTLSKLIRKDKFYHVEKIFKVKSLKNHFCRLRMYQAFHENIYFHSRLIKKYSTYYEEMYNELSKLYDKPSHYYKESYYQLPLKTQAETANIDVNVLEYFKEELEGIYPNTYDKRLYKEELYLELLFFYNKIKDAEYIMPNAPKKVMNKFIATLKCLKLKENYLNSSLLTPKNS